MATLLVLHGPNLNLLGTREPGVYGAVTLEQINLDLERRAREAGHHLLYLQSNAEYELIDRIQHSLRSTLELPTGFAKWHPLAQAQYLEISTFMSPYLLSSQGDRPGMAHSVEGRFPFLDVRVMEFCNRLPAHLKLRGLTEKYLLKKLARQWLPDEIWRRHKQPYRAPIHRSFFNEDTQDYVRELLSPTWIEKTGYFKADAVQQMVEKVSRGGRLSETDDMALAGILSTQLVHQSFVEDFRVSPSLDAMDDVKVCRKKIGQGVHDAVS